MFVPFPHFKDYVHTPAIPALYANAYSYEQQLKELCKEYLKLVGFTDSMVDTVNNQYKIIEEMKEQFPDLVLDDTKDYIDELVSTGSFNQILEEAAAEFLEQKTAQITANTEAIEANSEAIQTNSDDIQTNTNAIATINQTIDRLGEASEKDVDDTVIDGSENLPTSNAVFDFVIGEVEKSRIKLSRQSVYKYVNAVTGSDENGDGSELLPWKTLEHAVNEENKNGIIDIRLRFTSAGTYRLTGNAVTNGAFHLEANADGVILDFGEGIDPTKKYTFYGTHLNASTVSGFSKMIIKTSETDNGINFEFATVEFDNVKVQCPIASYNCYTSFENCEIVNIYDRAGTVTFTGSLVVNNQATTHAIRTLNGKIFINTSSLEFAEATEDNTMSAIYALFGHIFIKDNLVINTLERKYRYGYDLQACILHCSDATSTALTSVGTSNRTRLNSVTINGVATIPQQ